MKKYIFVLVLLMLSLMILSAKQSSEEDMDKLKQEIMDVERRFADMAAEKGVSEAFLFFAAEDAVIMRNNKIYKGKTAIKRYFDSSELIDVNLQWKPDYIDVSSSGDLAYTYGKFSFSAKDKAGKLLKSNGIFHTVWKRQPNGKWRFVWD